MNNSAATLYCSNLNCQAPNLQSHNFCQKCRTPLLKWYLWAVGEGIEAYKAGDLIAERYLLNSDRIILDTKPALAPEMLPEIPNILTAKNVEKTVANRRLLVKEVKQAGEQYTVHVSIFRAGMSPGDWSTLSYPGNAVRLLDKDGKALSHQGGGGGGGADEMTYTWTFGRQNWGGDDRPGEPHRLVWEIPTETREMNVGFDFKDLPMP